MMTSTGEDTDLEHKMDASHSDEEEPEVQPCPVGKDYDQDPRRYHPSVVNDHVSDRMAQLLAIYQKKVHDSKRVIVRLKQQKDAQLQSVINQLLVLEAQLRREQKGIVGQLVERDNVISAQRQEIERLRRDNRRLINKLKKFSEMCEKAGKANQTEPRMKVSRVESTECNTSPSKLQNTNVNNSPVSRKTSSGMIRVATSISELISLNNDGNLLKHHDTHNHGVSSKNHHSVEYVNPNVASVRATTNRVFHKPPIAEKPKSLNRVVQIHPNNKNYQQQVFVTSGEKECSIVSTISRLLEEESDATNTGGSGSSEPSSPEATLKPITPRVIRLARQFEEGMNTHNANTLTSNSSPEFLRSEEQTSKSYIMDEYEVTSGYNSDSISEHEYENIRLSNGSEITSPKHDLKVENKDEENDEDNYVILRAVKEEHGYGNWIDIPEDQHIYSNVEFGSGLLVKNIDSDDGDGYTTIGLPSEDVSDNASSSPQKGSNGILETNLDTSNSSDHQLSESLRIAAANVPRSRHNINLIMERDGDHMTENFEEFTLDSLELEEDQGNDCLHDQGKENLPASEQRKCGDGAEAKMNFRNKEETSSGHKDGKEATSGPNNGPYEKFLEATGLSQKSILTPTRMFSNHRSMLKPRDIKHRDKLRTTFTSHSAYEDSQNSSGSYKYWTEPYL
ncbi:uncharacterized protein [Palaemon carinicauda]|uniref:uncharacterized protein isoform X2 n=1 Tax=Palaemon carinicauda TaxID=392227 RepID=UPI0035B663C0